MSLIEQRQRRILTTHVGSLPRPPSLSAKLFARMTGESYDPKAGMRACRLKFQFLAAADEIACQMRLGV